MPKKSKKSKKGKKSDEKKDEPMDKMVERNGEIMAFRLKMLEAAKEHFRDTSRQLVEEKNGLLDYMRQTEKDTMDVVSYLKKLDSDKDDEIATLRKELNGIHDDYAKQKMQMEDDFNVKLNESQLQLERKITETEMLHKELDQLKEFRKRKIQMQKELEQIKEVMLLNEREHKEQTSRIEEKFFEEKMRLQIEANKKIEELAEKAQDAAVKNLDEVTRNIYKENVQLAESYKMNKEEVEYLRKQSTALLADNDKLRGEREGNNALVREKVSLAAKQAKQIRELQAKVETLEKALSQAVREFESERVSIIAKCKEEMEADRVELARLNKTLEAKKLEMNKVKKLAKNILGQRSEMEKFFLDSLDYVKLQISSNRAQYRKDANAMYNNRMLAAHLGQSNYPKIRTFSKKFDAFSTNNVYKDLEQAEKWHDINDMVDLADLTWEQKEQVLRELFARMNGAKANYGKEKQQQQQQQYALTFEDSNNNRMRESVNSDEENSSGDRKKSSKNEYATFMTQVNAANMDEVFSNKSLGLPGLDKLPSIQQTTHM